MNKQINVQEIYFDSDYLKAFLSGTKKTTICSGIRDYQIGPITLKSSDMVVIAQVTQVCWLRFSCLTEHHAKMDGFSTFTELRQVLLDIYPETTSDQHFTIVYLSL